MRRVAPLDADAADRDSCSCNAFVIFNERKLHEISMELQVFIFVTTRKPGIRGRAKLALTAPTVLGKMLPPHATDLAGLNCKMNSKMATQGTAQ